ncbi:MULTISPECIES: 3-methyl-2-oxobutanoate hydroxymethyltransferase [unclassified Chelatococcus]|uniref:3-methyl-2-oxobutanoate hydroxymethyltransferase n=1 Tax=unclassified Chelatococcus TaxID=2638111 RepID=UPI0002EE7895|nr:MULTISPECIES: 3-methyl-2-oxobutanoate hydroxymethyltransferase [unclassified Chelatococcus]ALA18694.1 3-methyl-2-oxobutanoate hydroxymethyltransferase [Chelatococcus sp. CO-6]
MSVVGGVRRLTAPDIRARKGGAPVVGLTAYHAPGARLADEHCDFLLVGDSLGMVLYGYDTTVPVTLDMMIAHGAAVVRASRHALVVVDLPFGSYEEGPQAAFRAASRVMKETGCGAVKLEGGCHMAATVGYLVERGIPVMGHVGLTPQSINSFGSFRPRGRDDMESEAIAADGEAVVSAGAFALVVEAVPVRVAAALTRAMPVPTIGIGASVVCDGQILVAEDMLGLTPRVPKFVRRYAEVGAIASDAVARYARDVRNRAFPGVENTYAEPGFEAPEIDLPDDEPSAAAK